MKKWEVRFAGFGGQGIILASYIVGKAAALYDEKKATHTQSYGPEARGGACSAGVVISDINIDFPFVQNPDVLVLMSQEAYTTYIDQCKKDTLVLIDEDLVEIKKKEIDRRYYRIPATRIAEGLQRKIVANIVMLGFFTAITGIVKKESMEKSIETSVPAPLVKLNIEAFNKGFEYAEKLTEGGAATQMQETRSP